MMIASNILFIHVIPDLTSLLFQCWEDRDGRKQMSKNNAKGLTTLRQKLRKYNRDFEDQINVYKEVHNTWFLSCYGSSL